MEKRGLYCTAGGNVNWYSHYGEWYGLLNKPGIKLPYDPAIPLVGIYPEKTTILKGICTPMFTAALFTLATTWKQPRCQYRRCGGGRCILYIYIYEYYSAIKRNKFESVVVRWMNLESVILNEISQKEKNKHHILSPSGSVGKESACNAGDRASIPGSGRSPGGRNGNPLQYSCLDRIPWTEEPGRLAKSQI